MSIMKELGAYDDIVANTADPGELNLTGFRYVFGAGEHEVIMKVSSLIHL